MSAQASRYQGLASQYDAERAQRFRDNAAAAAQRWSQDPFLQFQPGMTSSFGEEGIRQAGEAVAQANRFSQALGLTPEQTEGFQRAISQAELERNRAMGNISDMESESRRAAEQALRNIRGRGAGSMADLQQAAAARGLMASPAAYDVGQDTIAGGVAAAQAQQQADLASYLSQLEAQRGQTTSAYRSILDDIARQRLAAELENERNAIDRLLGGWA